MGVRSLNGLNGTDTNVVITNRMLATEPLEMTQDTFTDPIVMKIKGLSGFGSNGQILETTGSQIQYRTAPVESNWTNSNGFLYPKDGVDEDVVIGATTNPNDAKLLITNGDLEIANNSLKFTGTNQEIEFEDNDGSKGLYFHTSAGATKGFKMYGVNADSGMARIDQLENSDYMLQLYANDASRNYYEFNRGVLDIRNTGTSTSNISNINFKDYDTATHKKFQLESNLNNETFKLKFNDTGTLDEEEDVMTINCDTNTDRTITFDKTTTTTISGGTSANDCKLKIIADTAGTQTNANAVLELLQNQGIEGAQLKMNNNGDVILQQSGSVSKKLMFSTQGADIEFYGGFDASAPQFGSIGTLVSDFLSTDTRVKRLKLKPNTHTTTIQENGSIAGDITLTLPATTGTIALTGSFQTPIWNVVNTTELIADPKEDDSNICSKLTISSGAGANGDCLLLIEADTDDGVETANPKIQLRQDGGATNAYLELANNDFLIGSAENANNTILYTNNGAIVFSADSGSSYDIATFTTTLSDLKSTSTKVVKLQTDTIEGTTTATNKIESTTDGWKITTDSSDKTLVLDNGGGSYYPYFDVDSATATSVPFQLIINSIGSAYVINRPSESTTQADLEHVFYGSGIFADSLGANNQSNNTITSDSTKGWIFEANNTQRTIEIRGSSYYPYLGCVGDSEPYIIHINNISGNAYTIENTNNAMGGIKHDFEGAEIKVPGIRDRANTDNYIFGDATGWALESETPQYALELRLSSTGGTYDPKLGTISDDNPFTISLGSLDQVYNINNTNDTTAGLNHKFKGTVRADYLSGLTYTDNQFFSSSIGWDIYTEEPRYALTIRNGTDYYPYLGTPNATTLFMIYINTINDTAYEIINTDNTIAGVRHELVGAETQMCNARVGWKYDNSAYTYLYSPEGTNGAASFGGSYISWHDNGSAIYFNLPGGGTSAGDYVSWATNNSQKARISMDGAGKITGSWTGSWAGTSDRRLKENIVPIENAVETLMKINVYQFDKYDIDNFDCIHHEGDEKDTLKPFKDRLSKDKRFVYGFIAQELCENTPEIGKMCVETNGFGTEEPAYIIDDRSMLACAIKTIQTQQEEINTLKQEVNTYKSIIDKLVSATSFKAFKQSLE